ncbi:uncharacterized protein LOC111942987 [Cyanistes caeruleus]|uniref:uncharacterized protein LOC111942987 n=1 Tax=Cyanistes caeruleus TaxID=156563 RepID=UPI000CDA7F40|nr:uncharacterized protein LOC111942987 [Cyanistes caeruleus]
MVPQRVLLGSCFLPQLFLPSFPLTPTLLFANGFANVTVQPAKLYFIAFHIVMVIIIVNIFVSFILEAFFVEYSLEKSEVETAIEQKIQELGMGVQEDELHHEQLLDNMESAEHELEGEGGTKSQSKGLVFKIASKPSSPLPPQPFCVPCLHEPPSGDTALVAEVVLCQDTCFPFSFLYGLCIPAALDHGGTIPPFLWLGYRTVDALLQRMFEAEIPLEDEGPSFEEILNLSPSSVPRSPGSESAA